MNAWHSEQLERLEEIGRHLQQCRQQQSLSLRKIAAKTYIRPSILEAIEKADTTSLPEPVYIQGFLRRYGDALGLNGDELAQQLPVATLQSASETSLQTVSETSDTSSGFWTAIQNLSLQISSFFNGSDAEPAEPEHPGENMATTTPSKPEPPPEEQESTDGADGNGSEASPGRGVSPTVVSGLVGLAAVAGLVVYVWRPSLSVFSAKTTSEPTTTAPSPEVVPPKQAGVAGNQAQPSESPGNASQQEQKQAATAASQPESFPIVVEATDRCWVRVQTGGEILFEGILNPGDRKTWNAEGEVTILAGNAGGLLVSKGKSGTPKRLGASGQPKQVTLDTKKPEIQAF